MSKKIIGKFIAPMVLAIVCLLSVSFSVYAAKKSQNNYTSTLAFQGEYAGATRHFSHQHISFSATASSYLGKNKLSKKNTNYSDTYKVSLYRKTWLWFSERVGSKSLSRYSYGKSVWTNVGSGDYYFYFEKARDGVNVISPDVVMKGYD